MGVYGGAFGKKTSSVPHDWAEPGRAGAEPGRAVPGEPGWAELCRAEPSRAETGGVVLGGRCKIESAIYIYREREREIRLYIYIYI